MTACFKKRIFVPDARICERSIVGNRLEQEVIIQGEHVETEKETDGDHRNRESQNWEVEWDQA